MFAAPVAGFSPGIVCSGFCSGRERHFTTEIMSEEADSLSDQSSDLEAEHYAERYGGYSEEITASKAVHKSKPLPCSLPDPENAYTIEQVRNNLIEMEAQLASYPVNLSRGPGWVRQQILSILDRGIQP